MLKNIIRLKKNQQQQPSITTTNTKKTTQTLTEPVLINSQFVGNPF